MKAIPMTRVSQLMNRDVKTCTAQDDLGRAAQLMWDHDCGFVPVVEFTAQGHRRVVGVVTDRDVCMATYTKGLAPGAIRVGDVMSRGVRTCRLEDTPDTAELSMRQYRVRRLPVIDAEEDLVGVLSLSDLVRWGAHERWPKTTPSPLEGVASTLAAVCEPWRAIRSTSSVAGPEKNGSPFDRRGFSTAEEALARRQASDEQC
jgi:CBS domain-containing protein